jgi:hypothetical protein
MEAGDAVATAAVEVDRPMWASLENTAHQTREHRPGAHLDERPNALRVHGLDLFDEAH